MTDFEDALRRRLHESAGRVGVPEGLGSRARRGGTRRRRRRRLLMAAPVTGAVAVLGLVAWLGPAPVTTSLAPAQARGDAPVRMTPELEESLEALREPGLRVGHNDPFTNPTPLNQWTTWIDCDRLSAHLGIPLPSFDALDGYRVACGSSWQGDDVFQRPVPPDTADTTDEETTRVEILYLPPGVDEQTATFADAAAAGASWMLISYGGDLRGSDESELDAVGEGRPDATVLTLASGQPAGVQIAESGTAIGWSSEVAGRRYGIQLYQPRDPLESVQVFSSGHDVPG